MVINKFFRKFKDITEPFEWFPIYWPICFLMWAMDHTDEWELTAIVMAVGVPLMVILMIAMIPVTAIVVLGMLLVAIVRAPYILYKKHKRA
jgi:hypothetical protein